MLVVASSSSFAGERREEDRGLCLGRRGDDARVILFPRVGILLSLRDAMRGIGDDGARDVTHGNTGDGVGGGGAVWVFERW